MFNSNMFLKFASYRDGKLEVFEKKENVTLYSYIYAIVIENEIYIGSSADIWNRTQGHKFAFLKNKNVPKLQKAFDEKKIFDVYLIMRLKKDNYFQKYAEQFFISLLEPSLNIVPSLSYDFIKQGHVWGSEKSEGYIEKLKQEVLSKATKTNDKIRNLCFFMKITQKSVAEQINMKEYLFRKKIGENSFNDNELEKIAKVLGVTAKQLRIGNVVEQKPSQKVVFAPYSSCPHCGRKVKLLLQAVSG